MNDTQAQTEQPTRAAKIGGADHELCNFILGTGQIGKTDAAASRALLREIHGFSAHAVPLSQVVHCDSDAPTDWGRRYLANGGAAYIDSHKLEVCTPEVRSATEFAAATHAMYSIVAQARDAANAGLPEGQKLVVIANNSDGWGNSWGSHVNLLLTRRAWDSIFQRNPCHALFLATHLVSSMVCTGAGKVGSENGTAPVDYQISCRADFFENTVGGQTMFRRPILNSRDEPLCGRTTEAADDYARLHTIVYDANMAHPSNVLKFGCLQIVSAMIEAELVDLTLLLRDPVEAIVAFSHDPTLETRTQTLGGVDYTAVELQLLLFERAKRFQETGGLDGIVPGHEEIMSLWLDTLEKLKNGDFPALARRLDWVIKLRAILDAMGQYPELQWDSPEVKHLDLAYANLDPCDGIYWHCERSGSVETLCADDLIERFVHRPPADTRAWGRSELLRRAHGRSLAEVDWDRLKFTVRGGSKPVYRTLDLGGPDSFTRDLVGVPLSSSLPLDQLLDALGAPPDDQEHDDRFVAVVPAAVERALSSEEHELIIRQSRQYIDQ